jgi:L-ascorbate metabolism protein UlaG (beta-lactamase superfamily)
MTGVRWYGQSAFLLRADSDVFIDPFGEMGAALASRGLEWRYPPIEHALVDLLLVTHEHGDHNAVGAVGAPVVLRSTAGRFDSPVGEVVGISSEHDDVAGTARGPNTIFCFSLAGLRICHLGDLGQPALRPEQRAAIGDVDLLFVPAGGGPTIGGERAAALVRELAPRLVIPMHYRTPLISFLDPPDEFLEALGAPVERIDSSELTVEQLLASAATTTVALLAPPRAAR